VHEQGSKKKGRGVTEIFDLLFELLHHLGHLESEGEVHTRSAHLQPQQL
jgi:hypothetical protein